MSVTITCPKCQAALKAKAAPPADQPIQCPRCKQRFVLADKTRVTQGTKLAAPKADSHKVDSHKVAAPVAKLASPVTKSAPKAAAARAASAPTRHVPIARSGFRWYHGVLAAVVGLFLVGGGVAGSIWYSQQQVGPSPKTQPVDVARVEPKAEKPKAEVKAPVAAKVDPAEAQRKVDFLASLKEGDRARQKKKWDDALAAYGEARVLYPDDAGVKASIDAVKAAKADEILAQAEAEKRKTDVAALTQQAKKLLGMKQPAEAVKLLETALSMIPNDPDATQVLADARAAIQDADPKRIGEKFDAHIHAGKAALKSNQPADAIKEFQLAKQLIPDDPLPPMLIAEAQKALVVAQNEKPAPKKKSDYEALMEKAKQLAKDKMYQAAAGAYNAALQLMPNDPDATAGLAAVQAQIATGKNDAKGLQAQADQALRNKQVDQAIALYKQALQANPDNADLQRALQTAIAIQVNSQAYYNAVATGTQAMINRDYLTAANAFNAALAIAPGDSYVTGNLLQAQNALAQIAQIQQAYQNLTGQAQAALRVQQYAQALKLLREAASLIRPPLTVDQTTINMANYADAMNRATQAMNSGRWAEAARFFQTALQYAPGDTFASFGLRQAQTKLQNQPQPKR